MQLEKTYERMRALTYPGDDMTPIYVHINSYGGDVDAALGLIDTMLSLKDRGAKIVTIIEGYAASAATMISIAGTERRMRPNAYMRIHQFRSGYWGKKTDLDDEHTNMEKLEEILVELYRSRTTMGKVQLKKLLSRELDLVPEECIERGLVDVIQN
jgi:ATP-dependent Clp protease protease subunit